MNNTTETDLDRAARELREANEQLSRQLDELEKAIARMNGDK